VCSAPALGVCAEVALPAEDLVAGVHHAHLDISAIERCRDSASELGICVASLDCVALASAEEACSAELERYSIDCAAFLTALDYLDFQGSGGASGAGGSSSGGAEGGSGGAEPPSGGTSTGGQAGGGGPATGGSQGDLPQALCRRAEHCGGVRWTLEQTVTCQAEVGALFIAGVPDPRATESCIQAAPCASLTSDPAATMAGCLDLATTYCLDARTLRVCNSSAACSDVSCRDVCQAQAALALGCGPSAAAATDECLCGP
jgi:hypothetical protein